MANGERFRRIFPTVQEATEFVDKLRQEEPPRVKGRLTVMDVVTNWYSDHKGNLSSGTRRDYEGRIQRDVSRIGDLQAEALARNPRDLRAFYASLTPTNARRLHAILRQAFHDAVMHGELSRNPCDVVKANRPRAAERLIPSPSEVEKMIVAAEEEDPNWASSSIFRRRWGRGVGRRAHSGGKTSTSESVEST